MNIFNKFKQVIGMRGGFIPKSLTRTRKRTQTKTKTKTKRRITSKKQVLFF